MTAYLVALGLLGIVNLAFSVILLKFSIRLFVMIYSLGGVVNRKFELGPNEVIKPVVLRFPDGKYMTRLDTGLPVGDITLLEYSNVPRMDPNDKR